MRRIAIALVMGLAAFALQAQTLEFYQQKVEATATYAAIIQAFQKEYPGITINQNTVPTPDAVLVTRMAGGDTPEIFSDFPTQMSFRPKVSAGYVKNLTGQSFLSRVNPALLNMSKLPDGNVYALPLSQNFGGVYYHKDIFKKYGLAIPRTYAELIAVCKKLKANGVVPFIFPDKNQVEHQYLISSGSIYPNFLSDLRKVRSGEKKLSDFPRFRRVAEVFLELRTYGSGDSLAVSYPASADAFANKAAAMTMLGSYAFTTMKKANPQAQIAMFPFPGDKAEDTSALAGIDAAVCISGHAKDEKDDLAFLEFLSRPSTAQIFADMDLTPSCITGVVNKNQDIDEVVKVINKGKVTEWIKGVFEAPVVKAHDDAVQALLLHKNIDRFLKEYESAIRDN